MPRLFHGLTLFSNFSKLSVSRILNLPPSFPMSFNPTKKYPVTTMPVYSALEARAIEQFSRDGNPLPLRNTLVYVLHHTLRTSMPLIEILFKLGAYPGNVFVLDKHYSRHEQTVADTKALGVHYLTGSPQINIGGFTTSSVRDSNWVWKDINDTIKKKNIKEVIIIDHGGIITPPIPKWIADKYTIVAIEKTPIGVRKISDSGELPFPIISVADCVIKKYIEPPFIAEVIFDKLKTVVDEIKASNAICGVIGYGAIGQTITEKLLSLGIKVIVFDKNPQIIIKKHDKLDRTSDVKAVFATADYILGCTGEDVTVDAIEILKHTAREKTLISCTSADYEYRKLLLALFPPTNRTQTETPLKDLYYETKMGGTLKILQGGFPINFDPKDDISVTDEKIDITRSLTLGAILQAIHYFKDPKVPSGFCIVEPQIQTWVMKEYLKHNVCDFSPALINNLQDEEWVKAQSLKLSEPNGKYHPCDILQDVSDTMRLVF